MTRVVQENSIFSAREFYLRRPSVWKGKDGEDTPLLAALSLLAVEPRHFLLACTFHGSDIFVGDMHHRLQMFFSGCAVGNRAGI